MNIAQMLLEKHNNYENFEHLVDVQGLSSPRVCNFLNDLVGHLGDDECYLEIGTWRGLTLCSAAHMNKGKVCYACDKFRVWGRWTGFGVMAKRALKRNINRYREQSAEIRFFHMTSKKFFELDAIKEPVKVYFYDGDHTYDGTRHGVVAARDVLASESILLMDDWADPVIREATYDGIQAAGFEIAWQKDLLKADGWWNGLGVFVLQK